MIEIISLIAAVLGIYQFTTQGKSLRLKVSKTKIERWNGLKVF